VRKAAFFVLALSLALVMIGVGAALGAETDPPGPTAAISSPAQAAVITGKTATITALFDAGSDAKVTAAELYVDGELHDSVALSPAVSSGKCKLTWRCGEFEAGKHTLTARVYDSSGHSRAVDVEVVLQRTAVPGAGIRVRVEIIAPKAGQEISGSTLVRVAADDSRVRYVMLLIDDVFVALTNMAPFSYMLDTTRYLNGPHTFRATAFDLNDDATDSNPVSAIINNPGGRTEMRGHAGTSTAAAQPTEAAAPQARAGLAPPAQTAPMTAAWSVAKPPAAAAAPRLPALSQAEGSSPKSRPVLPRDAAMTAAEAGVQVAALAPGIAQAAERAPAAAMRQPVASHKIEPATQIARAPSAPAVIVAKSPSVAAARPVLPRDAAMTVAEAGVQVAALAPGIAQTAERAPAAAMAAMRQPVASHKIEPVTQIARAPSPPVVVSAVPSGRTAVVLHTVRPGEQLGTIAALYHVPAREIARFNGRSSAAQLAAGETLRIPWSSAIMVDGKPVYTDVAVVNEGGIALAPVRAIIERAGGVVHWLPASRQVWAQASSRDIRVTIGSRTALVNAKECPMAAAAKLLSERAMVPVGLFRDALGFKVTFDQGTGRIYLAAQ